MTEQSRTVGVVMSGGGARGLAHVGVLKALRDASIDVSVFSGSSAGALVGLMAAAECSIDEMLAFWTESKPFRMSNLAFGEPGFFDTTTYIDTLKEYVTQETFEELPRKLIVAVTAMVEGKSKYFDSGPLWPIVLASASYPVVFSPITVDDEVYMDGGIMDNFPVNAIKGHCDVILGVNVSPKRVVTADDLSSVRDIIERVMDLQFGVGLDGKCESCDVTITPADLYQYGTFGTEAAEEIFARGVEAGEEAVPKIKSLLEAPPEDSSFSSARV